MIEGGQKRQEEKKGENRFSIEIITVQSDLTKHPAASTFQPATAVTPGHFKAPNLITCRSQQAKKDPGASSHLLPNTCGTPVSTVEML